MNEKKKTQKKHTHTHKQQLAFSLVEFKRLVGTPLKHLLAGIFAIQASLLRIRLNDFNFLMTQLQNLHFSEKA